MEELLKDAKFLTLLLIIVLIIAATALILVAVVGVYHEFKARKRAAEAVERHQLEMRALLESERMTRAAIYQRIDLESNVRWILEVLDEYARHLEALGRTVKNRYPPLNKGHTSAPHL